MMEHFQFAQPEWLYVLPFILCLLILRRRRGAEGSITYPTVRFIAPLARTPHSLAGKIGAVCFVLAAAAIAKSWVVLVYLPYLVLAGLITGTLTGLCAQLVVGRLSRN